MSTSTLICFTSMVFGCCLIAGCASNDLNQFKDRNVAQIDIKYYPEGSRGEFISKQLTGVDALNFVDILSSGSKRTPVKSLWRAAALCTIQYSDRTPITIAIDSSFQLWSKETSNYDFQLDDRSSSQLARMLSVKAEGN